MAGRRQYIIVTKFPESGCFRAWMNFRGGGRAIEALVHGTAKRKPGRCLKSSGVYRYSQRYPALAAGCPLVLGGS